MSFDRTKEPQPPKLHSQRAGHHWLQERTYDGHVLQTVCMQWQPGAKRWCRSGDVASGRDVDTRGWQYVGFCPMPQEAGYAEQSITLPVENSVWTALMPTEAEALEMQMKSMMFMQADQHYRKMSRDEQKTWLARSQIGDAFPQISDVTIGEILVILIQFGLPVSVTVGDENEVKKAH